ncbi:hypothetical protein ACFQ61_28485 [Streptomyces sp. NPDC056500]|uniref:hypothetical protein n=1 Tax=Streptomyces sp. NPDC056500 TaxID=3345840 RepID=UPI0036CA483E
MARAASVREAPVVIRSSTSTALPPSSSRREPGATSNAPARFCALCAAVRPAWSKISLCCRNTGSTRDSKPPRRSSRAAAKAIRRAGSCPLARTARRADGMGTSSSGPAAS